MKLGVFTTLLRDIRTVACDCAVGIKHEDSLMSVSEGLCKGLRNAQRRSCNRKDRQDAAVD